MSLYSILTVITVCLLLGMFLGWWLFCKALNSCISAGMADLFIKGRRIDKLTMWME